MTIAKELLHTINEIISDKELNEMYFAYNLLEKYVPYKDYGEKLLKGVKIRIGKELDFTKEMSEDGEISEKEFQRIVKKFFSSKGIRLTDRDYGIPEPWPIMVGYESSEDSWGNELPKGETVTLYEDIAYYLYGKGKYIEGYKIKLDSVEIIAEAEGEDLYTGADFSTETWRRTIYKESFEGGE